MRRMIADAVTIVVSVLIGTAIGISLVASCGKELGTESPEIYRPVPDDRPWCVRDLEGLRLVTESHQDSYDREAFGDYDRDHVLKLFRTPDGRYLSPYDGESYDDPSRVEVDHTVALAEAWRSGAWEWDARRLETFGGDTRNLTTLTAEVNREKSDDDPADWVPPSEDARDDFLQRWLIVKTEYDLAVDPDEWNALAKLCLKVTGGDK